MYKEDRKGKLVSSVHVLPYHHPPQSRVFVRVYGVVVLQRAFDKDKRRRSEEEGSMPS